jgi:hypothetical protein
MSTDAKRRANAKYLSKQDEIRIRIPKGHKERDPAAAEEAGQSMNQYILEAIAAPDVGRRRNGCHIDAARFVQAHKSKKKDRHCLSFPVCFLAGSLIRILMLRCVFLIVAFVTASKSIDEASQKCGYPLRLLTSSPATAPLLPARLNQTAKDSFRFL